MTGRESTFTKTASGRAIQTWTCPPWAAWPQGHCPVTLQLEDTEAWMPASLWDCPGDGRLAACPDLLGCSPPQPKRTEHPPQVFLRPWSQAGQVHEAPGTGP